MGSPEARPEFNLQPFSAVPESARSQVHNLHRDAYSKVGLWIGDEKYKGLTEPTTSHLATITIEGELAAAANLNVGRVGIIATNPQHKFAGRGLVSELFNGLQEKGVSAWITISTADAAIPMMKAVTGKGTPLEVVRDPEMIEELFTFETELTQRRQFTYKRVAHPELTQRLEKKQGIRENDFVAVSSTPSLHGEMYQQVVFKLK